MRAVAIALSRQPAVYFPTGIPEVSRFSCTKFPGVSGVYDFAGLTAGSRYRPRSCCLPPNPEHRRPDCNFSKLDTPAHLYLCSRFARYRAAPNARLEAERVANPFS
jgi:hypothetical protein